MLVSILNRRWYDYYWIGLNDLAQTGKYEWVITDGSSANYDNFQFWAPGMPSDSDGARCTFMLFSDHLPGGETYGREGKWVKGICNQAYKYICRVKESNFVSNCPSGNSWKYAEQANKCYKYVIEPYGIIRVLFGKKTVQEISTRDRISRSSKTENPTMIETKKSSSQTFVGKTGAVLYIKGTYV